jgi:hypothetical protein
MRATQTEYEKRLIRNHYEKAHYIPGSSLFKGHLSDRMPVGQRFGKMDLEGEVGA